MSRMAGATEPRRRGLLPRMNPAESFQASSIATLPPPSLQPFMKASNPYEQG